MKEAAPGRRYQAGGLAQGGEELPKAEAAQGVEFAWELSAYQWVTFFLSLFLFLCISLGVPSLLSPHLPISEPSPPLHSPSLHPCCFLYLTPLTLSL